MAWYDHGRNTEIIKVKELDRCLDNHRLSFIKKGKKDDKIKAIMYNVLQENQNIITKKLIEISNEESDSDEDCKSSGVSPYSCSD